VNPLLEQYRADIEFPEVSGAEHLEMLQRRDRLFEIEASLSAEERQILEQADRRLVEQSAAFYAELSRFVNLVSERQNRSISADRWWWYLDVLAQLPNLNQSVASR
jgi:hypothetical protein